MNVDAGSSSGPILAGADWVDHASYNVYALPTENPNDGARAVLTNPNDTTYSPFGWHDTNGVAGPEYTITRGNNVFAYTDLGNTNTPGFSPDGTSALNFDFPVDLTQSPSTTANQSVGVTNLFYLNNVLHDVHARYGFTEAAGNFQSLNYTGTGAGNDAVLAEAQDGGGVNNANFATPADGAAPRMQMYLWNSSSPSCGWWLIQRNRCGAKCNGSPCMAVVRDCRLCLRARLPGQTHTHDRAVPARRRQ